VNNAAAVLDNVGTYEWNEKVYSALSLASRVASSIKNRANAFKLAYNLYSLNGLLVKFLTTVHDGAQGKLPTNPDAEPVTPKRLRDAADQLENLFHTLDYIYEGCRRAGLTNNSLTAASVNSIHRQSEELAVLADWCAVLSQPDEVDVIFERAKDQRENGELLGFSQVR
jgi:hypothetical protein